MKSGGRRRLEEPAEGRGAVRRVGRQSTKVLSLDSTLGERRNDTRIRMRVTFARRAAVESLGAPVLAARLGIGGALGVRVPGVDGRLGVSGALGVRGRGVGGVPPVLAARLGMGGAVVRPGVDGWLGVAAAHVCLACAGVESACVPPRDQSWRLAACRLSWRLGSAQAEYLAYMCQESMGGSACAAHLACAGVESLGVPLAGSTRRGLPALGVLGGRLGGSGRRSPLSPSAVFTHER